jgi:mutator protein MutT
MSASSTPIGIAVVAQNGRYLVGVRGPESSLAGAAEFPGGKCHPDEAPRDCAVRECLEETGLRVTATTELHREQFEYPHGRVDLHFWLCQLVAGENISADHQGFRWVAVEDLASLNFPAGNAKLIGLLTTRG